MIGDEPYAPYQRPPLSKKFLTERPPADTLYFRPEKFWGEQGVTADYGVPVESIDRAGKRVTFEGGHADYGTLFLATGTRARDLPVPGARPRRRVLAAQDRRRARAARPARCRQAHRHRRRRLYRARGRGGRARRGAGGHGAGGRGSRDEARHLAGDLELHAGLPSQPRRRHPRSARGLPRSKASGKVAQVSLADGATLPADLVLLAVGAQAERRSRRRGGPAVRGRRGGRRARPHRRSGDLCGRRLHALSRAGATAASCGSNACRTRSIRPRRSPPRSSASRSPTIRCRGSGRTSTS